ncbi:MAG: hypothetical protein AAGD14_12700 [Planctomycetota bacterium]
MTCKRITLGEDGFPLRVLLGDFDAFNPLMLLMDALGGAVTFRFLKPDGTREEKAASSIGPGLAEWIVEDAFFANTADVGRWAFQLVVQPGETLPPQSWRWTSPMIYFDLVA